MMSPSHPWMGLSCCAHRSTSGSSGQMAVVPVGRLLNAAYEVLVLAWDEKGKEEANRLLYWHVRITVLAI